MKHRREAPARCLNEKGRPRVSAAGLLGYSRGELRLDGLAVLDAAVRLGAIAAGLVGAVIAVVGAVVVVGAVTSGLVDFIRLVVGVVGSFVRVVVVVVDCGVALLALVAVL